MNTTQRNAINGGTLANSLLIFNITDNCLQIYNDNSNTWENIHCFLNCSTAPAQPTAISGNATPCQNASSLSYYIAQVTGATGYTWTVPSGATILAGQGTTGITVDMGTSNGNVVVIASNSCGISSAQTLAINLETTPSQPSTITGNTTICQGDNGEAYSVVNVTGVTYGWSYSGSGYTCATNCTTNSITANFSGSATSGTLTATPSNACGNGTARDLSITVSSVPSTPTANAATNITQTDFDANWGAVAGATGYFLDVATDVGFTSFVTGYNNKSLGAVLTDNISGLTNNTTYYYRVRATNSCGTSASSNTITATTFCLGPNFTQRYSDTGTPSSDGMPSRTYIGGKVQGGNGIIGKKLSKIDIYMVRTGAGMTGTLQILVGGAVFLSVDPMSISTSFSWHTFQVECAEDAILVSSGDCIQFYKNDVNFNGGSIQISATDGGSSNLQWIRGASSCSGTAGFGTRAILYSDD